MNDERGLGQGDAAQKDGAGFVQHVANEAAPGERASIVFFDSVEILCKTVEQSAATMRLSEFYEIDR